MATIIPTCLCPGDSQVVALGKISNNLSALFYLMSAGSFVGQTVNFGDCRCSQSQMLATLNNNVAGFFTWFVENGGSVIDPTITSWAQLAALPTTELATGTIKLWVDSSVGILRATQLLAGTDATDTASGIQRPDDYNAGTNARVWYNKLS